MFSKNRYLLLVLFLAVLFAVVVGLQQKFKVSSLVGSLSTFLPFDTSSNEELTINDFHTQLDIGLANGKKFDRFAAAFPEVFQDKNIKKTIINVIDVPTTTENFSWGEDIIHGYSAQIQDNNLIITIFINMDQVKKSGWNTNSLVAELEFIVVKALYHVRREIRGELRYRTLEGEKTAAKQRTKEIQEILISTEQMPSLLWVGYE